MFHNVVRLQSLDEVPRGARVNFSDYFRAENPEMFKHDALAFDRTRRYALVVTPVEITRIGVTRTVYLMASADPQAYFRGAGGNSPSSLEELVRRFRGWAQGGGDLPDRRETRFDQQFLGADSDQPEVAVWWALDQNFTYAWTLNSKTTIDFLSAVTPQALAPIRPRRRMWPRWPNRVHAV